MNRRGFLQAAAGAGAALWAPLGWTGQTQPWRSWRVNGQRLNHRLRHKLLGH